MNTMNGNYRRNAYWAGYRDGQNDYRLRFRSDYAYFGVDCDPYDSWSYWYSRGYRQGQRP